VENDEFVDYNNSNEFIILINYIRNHTMIARPKVARTCSMTLLLCMVSLFNFSAHGTVNLRTVLTSQPKAPSLSAAESMKTTTVNCEYYLLFLGPDDSSPTRMRDNPKFIHHLRTECKKFLANIQEYEKPNLTDTETKQIAVTDNLIRYFECETELRLLDLKNVSEQKEQKKADILAEMNNIKEQLDRDGYKFE
jgi:hypothetical protein